MENKINLVLLIGTSPLPNLISFLALRDSYNYSIEKLILIYSEKNSRQAGTRQFANDLTEVLADSYNFKKKKVEYIPLSDISDATAIQNDLNKYELDKLTGEMHLNYTGGTKAMAVHVYKYFEKTYGDYFSASYLDSRNFQLKFDSSNAGNEIDLRDKINIGIYDMLWLHGYDYSNINITEENLAKPEFSSYATQTHQINKWLKEGNFDTIFKDFSDNAFNKIFSFKKFGKIKKQPYNETRIDAFNRYLTEHQEIKDWLSSFPPNSSLLKNGELWIPNKDDNRTKVRDRLQRTFDYINGFWLENLIAQRIEALKNKISLQKGFFGFSLEAKKDINFHINNFEIDAILINGYQLIGISITTSKDYSRIKNKGFEIIHRTRQIGGEEAIAVLVTPFKKEDTIGNRSERNKIKTLRNELSLFTGANGEHILVLGQEDWLAIDTILLHKYFNNKQQ